MIDAPHLFDLSSTRITKGIAYQIQGLNLAPPLSLPLWIISPICLYRCFCMNAYKVFEENPSRLQVQINSCFFYHVYSIIYFFEILLAIKDDTCPFCVLFVQMFVWKNHGPVRDLNPLDIIWYVPLWNTYIYFFLPSCISISCCLIKHVYSWYIVLQIFILYFLGRS